MLTTAEVKTIVERALNGEKSVRVLDYQLSPFSKDQVGFLGDHRNLEVRIKRGQDPSAKIETLRFFAKGLPDSSQFQTAFIRGSNLFGQEGAFFMQVLPQLLENYVGPDFCPRCYLANGEVVVLEDMRIRGYAMRRDNQRQLTGQDLESALRAQARLHAASLLAEARLGQPLDRYCPEACVDVLFGERAADRPGVHLAPDLLGRLARKLGLDPEKPEAALRRGFARMRRPQRENELSRVLCHGDTWPNNYLFDDSIQPPGCVLVDFQLARYAPRTYDCAQLMYLGASRETRQRNERGALEAYHKELCSTLERNAPEVPRPTFEQIWEEYESVRLSAMYAYVLYHPVLHMNQELMEQYHNDTDEFYKKIMMRQNNDYLMELYEEYPDYVSGLVSLMDELVEYCNAQGILENGKNEDEVLNG